MVRAKPPGQLQRRNRAPTRATLPAASTIPAPPLPIRGADEDPWHPLAIEWWTDLWSSPQSSRYTAMHKHRAYLALYTLDLFYKNPTERMGQRVEVALDGLGVKEADLRRLQWEVPLEQSTEKPAAKAKTTSSRRRDPRLRLVSNA